MAEQVKPILAERQRILQPLTFSENQVLSRDIPKDSVYKQLVLRLSGAVTTTFASGTPVADSLSTFDNIVPRIEIVINGGRVVKSVRPHLMHMQQILSAIVPGTRRASAGAAAATDNFPTADGGFAYGTTTQITTVAETILLSFENPYAKYGRETTWLDLRGATSAVLNCHCASFSKLLGFGNTAPVAYSASTFQIEIFTIDMPNAPVYAYADFRQTTREIQFSSETSNYRQPLTTGPGVALAGIMLFARDGAAGSATTATGKLPSNLLLTNLGLNINGQTSIKATSFKALQDEMRARFGIQAPFASNVSRIDGVAYLDLTSHGDIGTALRLERPQVDSCDLVLSTNTASNVSYTNPASVTIMTDEIVYPA